MEYVMGFRVGDARVKDETGRSLKGKILNVGGRDMEGGIIRGCV